MTYTEIKQLRKSLNLNTSSFGEILGVSGRTVEDWEQGRYEPSKPVTKLLEMLLKQHRTQLISER